MSVVSQVYVVLHHKHQLMRNVVQVFGLKEGWKVFHVNRGQATLFEATLFIAVQIVIYVEFAVSFQ